LYQLLIQPLIAKGALDGITQLGIAPNGVLYYLPFEVLHNGQRSLLDKYVIFYINSTSLLWVALDRSQSGSDEKSCLLAFGNPDGSLPYAESEVNRIAPLFACKTVYHQQDAKKAHLPTANLQHGVLHFATHGVFRSDNSTQSYLQMADGKLTVAEIWGLPLTGVRFTALSACQTGIGEILSGDDVVSLETAFIFAGSPTVIATLWKVYDQATAELMWRFYQHLLSGDPTAVALRAAKQELQQQEPYRHPYYWAAFTVRGVWQ
jgi:CHAT domain-containing protein